MAYGKSSSLLRDHLRHLLRRWRIETDHLPIDEEHPVVPMDSAMSKVVNEATARSFQRRSGADIYGLRINNVIEPRNTSRDSQLLKDPKLRLRNIFAYIDARDLGQMVDRCPKTTAWASKFSMYLTTTIQSAKPAKNCIPSSTTECRC